jgi:hypothetical protein
MLLKKLLSWGFTVLLLAAIFFTVPKLTKSSWTEMVEQGIEEYAEAVEEAQEGDDDDDDDDHSTQHQERQIVLDDEALEYAGIETLSLKKVHFFPEENAFAKVISLNELLVLRADYNQIRAELSVLQVAENAARQEFERLKKLSKTTSSVAAKNVTYAEVEWSAAKAKQQGLHYKIADMKALAMQKWGETISNWVFEGNSKQWQRLTARQDSLLLLTLPIMMNLSDTVNDIRVSQTESRDQARKAYFVDTANISGQHSHGETYFFKTVTGRLRDGMLLNAWIPKVTEELEGFYIPEQAIVWYSGQPAVFVEVEEGEYHRRELIEPEVAAGGVYVTQGMAIDDELVIRGAQMLLSEEFSWQIMDEDDD